MAPVFVVVDPPAVIEAEIHPLGHLHSQAQPGAGQRGGGAAPVFEPGVIEKGQHPEMAAVHRRKRRRELLSRVDRVLRNIWVTAQHRNFAQTPRHR